MRNINRRNKLVGELNHWIKEYAETWNLREWDDILVSCLDILPHMEISPSEEEKEYWKFLSKRVR